MKQQRVCPECTKPYDDVVVVDYLESRGIVAGRRVSDGGQPVYGCPNCRHVCGIGCSHAGDERLPAQPSL
jgi:hypothetical protein